MNKPEYMFKRRLKKILDEAGFLTVFCGKKQAFDMLAMKNSEIWPIEVKAVRGKYLVEQRAGQIALFNGINTQFFVIKQLSGGKMKIWSPNSIAGITDHRRLHMLREVFEKWLQ